MKFTFSVFFFFISIFLKAQVNVVGSINNTKGEPVPFANVLVKVYGKEDIVDFVTSNSLGQYRLVIEQEEFYKIRISCVGFSDTVFRLNISEQSKKQIVRDIILKNRTYNLEEVFVFANPPIINKKDTIIYNASFFTDGTERKVEDLLKKIPGVSVTETGGVKVNGKNVETVLIDGDNLFEERYKVLTKNLSAEFVDKVQILKKFADNPLEKEFQDNDHVAINLTFKDEKKKALFGETTINCGSNSNYNIDLSLISFLKKIKIYSISNMNNIGNESVDLYYDNNQLSNNQYDNSWETENNEFVIDILHENPDIDRENYNFNKPRYSSLSFICPVTKKTKIKGFGYINIDNIKRVSEVTESYNLETDTFSIMNKNQFNKKINDFYLKLASNTSISEKKIIKYTGDIIVNSFETNSVRKHDTTYFNEVLNDKPLGTSHLITYLQKISDKSLFTFNAAYKYQLKAQDYFVNTFLFESFFDLHETPDYLIQDVNNEMYYLGGIAKYIHKLKKDKLEASISVNDRHDLFNSKLFAVSENNSLYLINDQFENENEKKQLKLNANLKYDKYINKQLKLAGSLGLSYIKNRNIFFVRTDMDKVKNYLLLTPAIYIKWKHKDHTAFFNYSYQTADQDNIQLIPNYIMNNYRVLYRGDSNLELNKYSSFVLSYSKGNYLGKFFMNANVFYLINHKYNGSNSQINQEYSLSSIKQFTGGETFHVLLNIDKFINSLSSNVKFTLSYYSNNSQCAVNTNDNKTVNFNKTAFEIELRSVFSGFLNFHLGSKIEKNESVFFDKTTYISQKFFTDVNFNYKNKYYMLFENNFFYCSKLNQDYKDALFSDIKMEYNLNKRNINKISVSVVNLFNNKYFSNYSISDIYSSQKSFHLFSRYFLLGISIGF